MAQMTREEIVIATKPLEPILKVFSPVEDFHDEDLGSYYLKGRLYYLRDGNKKLGRKVQQWLKTNKVNLIEDAI